MSGFNPSRFVRTVSHLRPSQVLWRLRYIAERSALYNPPPERWAWKKVELPGTTHTFPKTPVTRTREPLIDPVDLLARGVFRHLNQDQTIGAESIDWKLGRTKTDRLWTTTLHYHEWAYLLAERAVSTSPGSIEAEALFYRYISDWIDRCRIDTPGARDLAWNAYATATRLTWWIRAYLLLSPARIRTQDKFHDSFLRSLWQQSAYLADHVEWDIRGNHVLRDAVGLAWAGRFFEEEQAVRWLDKATRIAVQQVEEQILPDGLHFELSPMYHLLVMNDVLTLYTLIRDLDAKQIMEDTWGKMATCASWFRHPDGNIALLNDAAFNATLKPLELIQIGINHGLQHAAPAVQGLKHFRDAGTIVWQGDPWTLFFDAGPVGAAYQPGHAHADSLSIEASLSGERLFVDPGTLRYDHDESRRYDRSTTAHNTVTIDGEDSSEVWGIFRVGRRARPLNIRAGTSEGGMQAEAAHDGYEHLFGSPRHTRRVEVTPDHTLVITDKITGRGKHTLEGGYLLAPGWKAVGAAEGWELKSDSAHARVIIRGPEGLNLEEYKCPYHPEFGGEVETTRIGWSLEMTEPAEITTTVVG